MNNPDPNHWVRKALANMDKIEDRLNQIIEGLELDEKSPPQCKNHNLVAISQTVNGDSLREITSDCKYCGEIEYR